MPNFRNLFFLFLIAAVASTNAMAQSKRSQSTLTFSVGPSLFALDHELLWRSSPRHAFEFGLVVFDTSPSGFFNFDNSKVYQIEGLYQFRLFYLSDQFSGQIGFGFRTAGANYLYNKSGFYIPVPFTLNYRVLSGPIRIRFRATTFPLNAPLLVILPTLGVGYSF